MQAITGSFTLAVWVALAGCASGTAVDAADAGHPATDASTDVTPDATVDGGGAGCDPAADKCPAAQHCDPAAHRCVDGCRSDDGCTDPKPHCDVAHHACVRCVSADQCPAGMACSDQTCVPGCTTARPCGGGATCCAGGCVDLQSSASNCGACATKCTVANGTATCAKGTCAIGDCGAGFADCNGKAADGCEADLRTDVGNCGKCGVACATTHASATCAASKCVLACAAGFADCDANPANGCEVDLAHDPKNCGACGKAPTEICNGLDDDCDGVPDEPFACVKGSGPRSCTTSCGSTGTQACSDACALGPCAPPAETCNLKDDDCNGKCDDLAGCRVNVSRSYNASTDEHFYTTNPAEAACCGFTVEYPSYFYLYAATQPGLAQFYRCVANGTHFYTTDPACEGTLVEGPIGWIGLSAVCGAVPLYRLVNLTTSVHLYTTDAAERDSAVAGGAYRFESIVGYVWTGPTG